MFEIKDNHLDLFKNINLENTRDRLIKVAMEMFAENGYDKTSVRELAKKADVNIAAINYHFEGKEGLYQAVLEYIIQYLDSWAMPLIEGYKTFLDTQKESFNVRETIKWIDTFLDTFIDKTFESYESNVLLNKILTREQLKPTLGFDKLYGFATIKLAEHIISDLLSKISKKEINNEKIIIYTLAIVGQIETFISTNSNMKLQLNVERLTKSQISIIKKILIDQVENSILNLSKPN